MDLVTLKSQIKTGCLEHTYIFTGPEVGVMDIYIRQMAKSFNAVITRPDNVADVLNSLRAFSLIKKRQICVFRDDRDYLYSEKLRAEIDGFCASDTVLVFVYTSIDKRSKFWKAYSDKILTFDYMKPDILTKYIKRDINLSNKNCERLIQVCGGDYSRILLEIDKIIRFRKACPQYTEDGAFESMLKEKAIYTEPTDAIFDFVDAVLKDSRTQAYTLLKSSYDYGEGTLVLLSVLYNNAKQLLQYQSYRGNNVAQITGLTPFQIKLAKARVGNYSNGELVKLMKLIRQVEVGIKRGDIDDAMAIDYVLVNLW